MGRTRCREKAGCRSVFGTSTLRSNVLSALCEADAKCGAAYDVPEMIDQAMALFDDGPISTTFQNPADPDMSFDLTVTERDLAEAIYGFQTGQIGIHALPAVLD